MKTMFAIAASLTLIVPAAATAAKVGDTRAAALADAQKRFGKIDADSDGKVTEAEMTAFLAKRATASGGEVKPKRVGRMMKRADANADGAITAAEMTAEAGARFDAADANKNGTIDAGEASAKGGDEG